MPCCILGVDLRSRNISDVAAVWDDSWVEGGDQLIGMLGDVFLQGITVKKLLNIWCTRQPGQVMHVRAALVPPLKPQPVVSGSDNSCVEGLDELQW